MVNLWITFIIGLCKFCSYWLYINLGLAVGKIWNNFRPKKYRGHLYNNYLSRTHAGISPSLSFLLLLHEIFNMFQFTVILRKQHAFLWVFLVYALKVGEWLKMYLGKDFCFKAFEWILILVLGGISIYLSLEMFSKYQTKDSTFH